MKPSLASMYLAVIAWPLFAKEVINQPLEIDRPPADDVRPMRLEFRPQFALVEATEVDRAVMLHSEWPSNASMTAA